MAPTRRQYILATNWLPDLWQWFWSLSAVGSTVWSLRPNSAAWHDLRFLLAGLVAVVIAFLVGWCVSIFVGGFIFGPLLFAQGEENGGPFIPGDWVQIIAGTHRGRVVQVYATAQGDGVRLSLGDKAKEEDTNVFAPHQLLRVAGSDGDA